MTRPSGDDRSVSRSAIFGVVRRTLFELHMCGLFHYTCFHLHTCYDHCITLFAIIYLVLNVFMGGCFAKDYVCSEHPGIRDN